MKNKSFGKTIITNSIFLAIGLLVGWFAPLIFKTHVTPQNISFNEQRGGMIKFTNPLLACDTGQESLVNPLGVSRFEIDKLVNKKITDGEAEHVSVYFRDLNNGPWIGIREKEEFMGGSLLKVPLMVAYLKDAELNPGLLEQKIKYGEINPQVSLSQFFQPSEGIQLGNTYTVWELIEYMIKYSDNNAADLLGKNIDPIKIIQTFQSLGVGLPDFNKPYPTSVRTYASFFRVLFNASYLNIEMSEKALDLLSQAEFSRGLRAGVPSDVGIAHKFGIREIGDTIGKQLHNCGIIYYPKHPYALCIMTRGKDFDKLAGVIKDISAEFYREIDMADSGGGDLKSR